MGRQRGSTRDDLLDAGIRLFRKVPAGFLKGLSVGIVAEEAGFHRQTFYRYWDTQAEFVDDLIRRLLSTTSVPVADGIEVLPTRRSEPQNPQEMAEDVARYDFHRVANDPSVLMRVGLLTMQALDDEPLAELTATYYDTSITRLAEAFASLLEGWGRECVPPFTPRDLARVQQALLMGFVLQDKAGIDEPPAVDLFRLSLAQVLMDFTRSVASDDGH